MRQGHIRAGITPASLSMHVACQEVCSKMGRSQPRSARCRLNNGAIMVKFGSPSRSSDGTASAADRLSHLASQSKEVRMKPLLAIVMISIGAASAFTVPVQAASLTISGDDGGVYVRRHHSRDHYDNYGDRRYGDMQYG